MAKAPADRFTLATGLTRAFSADGQTRTAAPVSGRWQAAILRYGAVAAAAAALAALVPILNRREPPYPIRFQNAFTAPPVFIAAMQTTDGGDPANLRWTNKTVNSVAVKVSEEQSKDNEITHTTEVVGYMLFSPAN